MSWESTAVDYEAINKRVSDRLGGVHSCKCIIYSFDFDQIEQLQKAGDWKTATDSLCEAAPGLKACGANGIVICTNTMHKLAAEVELRGGLPVLHISDATAVRIKNSNFTRVGLLGTRYTMEQDFYKGRLIDKDGLNIIIPDAHQRGNVHDVIYGELCNGIVKQESREKYVKIIQSLKEQGAQGVILDCTEIGWLVKPGDADLSLFETTLIHADMAAD